MMRAFLRAKRVIGKVRGNNTVRQSSGRDVSRRGAWPAIASIGAVDWTSATRRFNGMRAPWEGEPQVASLMDAR